MKYRTFVNTFLLFALVLANLTGPAYLPQQTASAAGLHRADALVLVNSTSANFADFQHYVQPYLDHFGIPYVQLDIATQPIAVEVGDFALIIIAHRQLDVNKEYIDSSEATNLLNAIGAGSGLVNFDNDLFAANGAARYDFINTIFGFIHGGSTSAAGVNFPNGLTHYVTERHLAGSNISTGSMTFPGIASLPTGVTALASSGDQPFLAVASYGAGQGRAVQWGSYDWMSVDVKGPMYGLDDMLWRSLVWAARKPFVMQGMPPFVTMRSDDESGNFEWIHIANEFGIKPWAGVFFHNIDESEAADLSNLVHSGNATTSIHAFNDSFFYFNHGTGDFSDENVAANFAEGTAWHQAHDIPISNYVLPHYYEFGTNVFQGLLDWGVEFVGTHMEPGNGYGAPWVMNGPYRLYETGGSSGTLPQFYADYLTIPGHPEFNKKFFNCVTEIRDDAGYEWYPDLNDVAGTVGRGTRQTVRALDSMALATLFTHGYYVSGNWNTTTGANWRTILQEITNNIHAYDPIYVTTDEACRYIRATHDSNIVSAAYDPLTHQVSTVLATVPGIAATDVATKFYVFMDGEGYVLVDAPAFTGSATVNYTIPGPLHHITITPNPASVVAGAAYPFSAVGYDTENLPIPNLTFTWGAAPSSGTIIPTGLFTAGLVPGSYPDAITATRSGITGSASVEITEPIIDHFAFAPIASPKYVGAPFTVTIRALDAGNNLVPGFTGLASLSDSAGALSLTQTGPFTGGVWAGPVQVSAIASNESLTATAGSVSGSSNSFSVQATPTCPCSIWDASAIPATANNPDPDGLEIGLKFRSTTDGSITALRVYRSTGNYAASMPGHLWSITGALLATVTFPPAASAGWQQVALGAPVAIQADTPYVASYYTNSGYPVSRPYFNEANRSQYSRPPITAYADGEQGGNGVYGYGTASLFPTLTYESTNYWVDVVFENQALADTTPPTISSTLPAGGATNVAPAANLTVQFSEPMNDYSITAATIELRDAVNTLVPAAVLYNPATNSAQVNPNAVLAFATQYTATVKGGLSGVVDKAGNPLVADFVWTFTTASAQALLHHFQFASISSPQTSGVPFQVTITARDANDNLFSGFSSGAVLSTSHGTIFPAQTGAFTNGAWTGQISLFNVTTVANVTLSASGDVHGVSSAFTLERAPDAPSFFTVTSDSTQQHQNTPFSVNIAAYPGTTIDLSNDAHQSPVLVTTSDPATLEVPGETDGRWTEFLYTTLRPFPVILAAVNEEDHGLPTLRFFADGIPDGTYQVIANLYDNAPMRYYYGYSPDDPKALSLDTYGGAVGTQCTEYTLAKVTITDGTFNLYVRDADLRSGGTNYPFFGWAGVRLVPITASQQIDAWNDANQSPVLATTSDLNQIQATDGQWTEFLYTPSRTYPTVLAGVNEETLGLPLLRIYANDIPNGHYEVIGNLFDNAALRYYYGFSADAPKAFHVDTAGGAPGTQHREFRLGGVDVTDGSFSLYVQDADLLSGDYAFFGWAGVRLEGAGVTLTSSSPTMEFDADGDGVFGEAGDTNLSLVNGAGSLFARDTTPGTGVTIRAADTLNHSGENRYSILALNSAPSAADDQYSANKDTPLTIAAPGVLDNDSDPDSDPLTAEGITSPAHGALTLNANGGFTYVPVSGYTGLDSFTYQANDGHSLSAPATVTIQVGTTTPPVLPSTFYGEIHFQTNPPAVGANLLVYVQDITAPVAATAVTQQGDGTLTYTVDIRGDDPATPQKEGGRANDPVTLVLNGRTVGSGVWVSGSPTRLDLHQHAYTLQPGWNLVSFNIIPADTKISALLANLAGRYDLVYAWNASTGGWNKFDNIETSPDDLHTLTQAQGFWLHVTGDSPVALEIVGALPTTTQITLSAGWNLIGYPAAGPGPITESLALVFTYHADDLGDPWKMLDRNGAVWANDLSEFVPGYGYWVHASAAGLLSITY